MAIYFYSNRIISDRHCARDNLHYILVANFYLGHKGLLRFVNDMGNYVIHTGKIGI